MLTVSYEEMVMWWKWSSYEVIQEESVAASNNMEQTLRNGH